MQLQNLLLALLLHEDAPGWGAIRPHQLDGQAVHCVQPWRHTIQHQTLHRDDVPLQGSRHITCLNECVMHSM